MEQYISKSALVAEIEKRIVEYKEMKIDSSYYEGMVASLEFFRDEFINTLEVKEVDLEKEYEEFVVDDPILGNFITNDTMGMMVAKHFFELGLKAQKGEVYEQSRR